MAIGGKRFTPEPSTGSKGVVHFGLNSGTQASFAISSHALCKWNANEKTAFQNDTRGGKKGHPISECFPCHFLHIDRQINPNEKLTGPEPDNGCVVEHLHVILGFQVGPRLHPAS